MIDTAGGAAPHQRLWPETLASEVRVATNHVYVLLQ